MTRREKHYQAIAERYGINPQISMESFIRRCRVAETGLHRLIESETNEYNSGWEWVDECEKRIKSRLLKLVTDKQKLESELYINRDPRGYTFKLNIPYNEMPNEMHRDWGGYGILAPDPEAWR